MPIIINEFEIIADPMPPAPEGAAGNPAAAPEPPALHPEDIVRIVRHQQQRLMRVRAD
jgi:hypothetical protein